MAAATVVMAFVLLHYTDLLYKFQALSSIGSGLKCLFTPGGFLTLPGSIFTGVLPSVLLFLFVLKLGYRIYALDGAVLFSQAFGLATEDLPWRIAARSISLYWRPAGCFSHYL